MPVDHSLHALLPTAYQLATCQQSAAKAEDTTPCPDKGEGYGVDEV